MLRKKDEIFRILKNLVLDKDTEAKIYLFGSRARGDAKPDSDWDFLILSDVYRNQKDISLLWDKIYEEIELKTESVISSFVKTKKEWAKYKNVPLYLNIKKEGILL